jgi:predicted MFS family arabinose efflux permease
LSTVSYAQLLRQNRNFRLLWLGQIVSQLGDWFSLITLHSLLLELTGKAGAVAQLTIAQMLPLFLFSPVAGAVVDRLSRKRVMVVADLARAMFALGFLLVQGQQSAWLAYLFMAAMASATAFFEPARQAVLPAVTRPDELVTANALSAVTWSTLLTSGALLGGVVAHLLGRDTAFVLNAVSFLGSAVLIRKVQAPRPEHRRSGGGFQDLRLGLGYVARRPDLLALLSVKAAWGLTYGSQVLTAVFGQQLFPLGPGMGPLSISLLTAVGGIGTAMGPVIGRRLVGSERHRMVAALPVAYLLAGASYLALARSSSLLSAAGALLFCRVGGSTLWVFSTVLLQQTADDQFMGRVFAAEGALFTLTMAISGYAVGQALDSGMSAFSASGVLGAFSLGAGTAWVVGLARWGWRVPDQQAGTETRPVGADCDPEAVP